MDWVEKQTNRDFMTEIFFNSGLTPAFGGKTNSIMKTHYAYESSDPEEFIEQHYCGTYAGENYEVSPFKENITCKKCLKKFEAFKKHHEEEQEYICNQMGEMADFFESQLSNP